MVKSLGLCIIVKNEAQVILRCLNSVRPLVDYVLVEDTGSTDGTQGIIRQWLARENLAGTVFDEPWRDFAHNRSLALARLREKHEIDYALVIDADDVLVCEPGFDPAAFKAGLSADFYDVEIRLGGLSYHRPQICSNHLEFSYRGVLHEFLEPPSGPRSRATVVGIRIDAGVEGSRSADPEKYRKDAALLEQALTSEQDPFLRSRYTFYLAQSWKDGGEGEKALAAYLERAGLGFWEEEVFYSLYKAAQLKDQLKHPGFEVIGMFLRAWEVCPHRAEALHGAARYCRITGKHHQGYMLAEQGLTISRPGNGLFIEPWIYEYGLLDEFAVNAYWIGRYDKCLDACERALREGKIPERMRGRIERNADFAREKLSATSFDVSAPPRSPSLARLTGSSDGKGLANGPKTFVFTLTTGRSGTAYLAALLHDNLPDAAGHHELLGWERFGVDTPDLSHFTVFNSLGNTDKICDFWRTKFARINRHSKDLYYETSHLLMKAGLVENLGEYFGDRVVHLIALERDPVSTILSYQSRYDFFNKGNMWLWYLDPAYPKKIVPFDQFDDKGIDGIRLWYIYEIRARAAFYEKILTDRTNLFVHRISLNQICTAEGARAFFDALGVRKDFPDIKIPSVQNPAAGRLSANDRLRVAVENLVESVECNIEFHVEAAIRRRFSFEAK